MNYEILIQKEYSSFISILTGTFIDLYSLKYKRNLKKEAPFIKN